MSHERIILSPIKHPVTLVMSSFLTYSISHVLDNFIYITVEQVQTEVEQRMVA